MTLLYQLRGSLREGTGSRGSLGEIVISKVSKWCNHFWLFIPLKTSTHNTASVDEKMGLSKEGLRDYPASLATASYADLSTSVCMCEMTAYFRLLFCARLALPVTVGPTFSKQKITSTWNIGIF